MKKESSDLTSAQMDELEALALLPDEQINTIDVPEQKNWVGAKRGVFFRPIKQQLTLRIDADVVAWFKQHAQNGHGYQTSINAVLRDYVEQQGRK